MATRERLYIEQLIKGWAQDHTIDYIISDAKDSDQGMISTGGYLTWLIQEKKANIDLLALVDRIELFLINKRRNKGIDGMFCRKCQSFYQFAEANQKDGSLICYTCRKNPYG
jgi:hypothetical protein